MSQLETSAGLSFGVSVVRGDWSVLIGGRLRPSLPLPRRGHSSVGRAPSLQGGCRRFESGWLHYSRALDREADAYGRTAAEAETALLRRARPAVLGDGHPCRYVGLDVEDRVELGFHSPKPRAYGAAGHPPQG